MPWISLAIETDDTHAQVLSDALMELGALSTDLHDAAAGTEREQLLFDEVGEANGQIWVASEVTAYSMKQRTYRFIVARCGGCGAGFRVPSAIARHAWKSRIGSELLRLSSIRSDIIALWQVPEPGIRCPIPPPST